MRVGTGHIEAVVVTGCEAIHRVMLVDLYGHPDDRAEELHRITSEMIADVPSPVFQVQRGFGAQLFGDDASLQDVLHRYGPEPDVLLRSMTGDNLLRVFADTVARAGATAYAAACYRALLPYAGLLNVGGGHSAGLPVDDVLGRLAALDGDLASSVRHLRDAVALARSMPSPPLLVHCLDHLADAVERAGGRAVEASGTSRRPCAPRPGPSRRPAASCGRGGRPSPTAGRADPPVTASMRRDGPTWVLRTPLGQARLPDSNGLGQLARLLAAPGRRGDGPRARRPDPRADRRRSRPGPRRPGEARVPPPPARAAGRDRRRRSDQAIPSAANGRTSRWTRCCGS